MVCCFPERSYVTSLTSLLNSDGIHCAKIKQGSSSTGLNLMSSSRDLAPCDDRRAGFLFAKLDSFYSPSDLFVG